MTDNSEILFVELFHFLFSLDDEVKLKFSNTLFLRNVYEFGAKMVYVLEHFHCSQDKIWICNLQ